MGYSGLVVNRATRILGYRVMMLGLESATSLLGDGVMGC